jgi:hypothetical protein
MRTLVVAALTITALTVTALTSLTAGTGSATADPVPIPAGFPLLSGYPAAARAEPGPHYGRFGPSRTMRPLVVEACGTRVAPPAGVDRLRAAWRNPEDDRERQLLLFGGPTAAQRYVDHVLDAYADCPREGTQGSRSHHLVRATELGDSSGVATTTYSYDGTPMPGLEVTHVVRDGRAVLVSTTSSEGMGADAAGERRRSARAISGVLAAMADLA